MTLLDEQLRREVTVIDFTSEKEVIKPAFEVKFIENGLNDEPQKFNWIIIGWQDESRLNLKLEFGNPVAVSMQDPPDYIDITFWDQSTLRSP